MTRWWWLLVLLSCGISLCFSEGRIGCLISPDLCVAGEDCIDDDLFGNCQDRFLPQDTFKFHLSLDSLLTLETEVQRLIKYEFSWYDDYTQCVLLSLLVADRYNIGYSREPCDNQLAEELVQGYERLQAYEALDELGLEPADEISQPDMDYIDSGVYGTPLHYYNEATGEYTNDPGQQSLQKYDFLSGGDNSDANLERLLILYLSNHYPELLKEAGTLPTDDINSDYDIREMEEGRVGVDKLQDMESMDHSEEPLFDDGLLDKSPAEESEMASLLQDDSKSERDEPKTLDDYLPPSFYDSLVASAEQKEPALDETKVSELSPEQEERLEDVLTAYLAEHGWPDEDVTDADIKKIIDLADQVVSEKRDEEYVEHIPIQDISRDGESAFNRVKGQPESIQYGDPKMLADEISDKDREIKLEVKSDKLAEPDDDDSVDLVDSSHAYIVTKDRLTPSVAQALLDAIASALDLDPPTFSDLRIDGSQMTFRVNPNERGMNASQVARAIDSDVVKKEVAGMATILDAGIGDKTKIQVKNADSRFFILTFVLCGCIAGCLLAVVVIYLIRRHSRSQAKLQNLTSNAESEVTKDYQDLCRQRMASKNGKPEPIHTTAGRVSSLTQSEASVRSPSSRSSTSSWSEEPATTNMDISTGHIVLSYMEDHLKNKDRLNEEWIALEAYEADPCSTAVASAEVNQSKNRFPECLPYDHSRVILNDSTNVNGADYINANTITDHDPRNPAYIATQGPLSHTVADFWQMVWEQGSVVIVMLTRLSENGVSMCHRYWPEEGSELYHIYEVHLVSEHIWCDDYLVRSFYLKNLQTNETRTVTQFHFLSWPADSVPTSPKALLEFRRKVNKSYRGRSCPIVVHCGDGSGRTGTYCLLDMVLNRLTKGAKEIDIAATLEHIRDQRMGVVKNKEQFEFALTSVAEEVHAILKALTQ